MGLGELLKSAQFLIAHSLLVSVLFMSRRFACIFPKADDIIDMTSHKFSALR
jgi:hypothetical protein